jgi:hypothetical protein
VNAAVRAVAAAQWRSRWRALLALGLLLGLAGGAVLAAAALGVRTATAYPRLVAATHLDDARALVPADQPGLAAAVPGLPGVVASRVDPTWIARVAGPALRFVSIGTAAAPGVDLVTPVLVAGRAPVAVDEVLVGEGFSGMSGLGLGDELPLAMLTVDEVAQFDVGFGEPDGPSTTVRIVGVGRMPAWGGALGNVLASPAFAQRFADDAVGRTASVRLAGDADAFAAAYQAAAAAQPPSVVAMYLPATVERPTAEVDPAVRTAERVLTGGIAVFATVLAAGGLLVVAQGLLRHHGAGREAQQVESALGLTGGQRVAARVLAAGPAAALAAAAAGVTTWASGALDPLGSQARFEPAPGFRPPWLIAVGGALAVAVLFLLLTAVAVALAGRTRRAPAPPAGGRASVVAGRPALVGAGLALRGRGGAAGAATVLGATLVVAGVVAAATFGAGVARLVDSPERWGEIADLTVVDAREADLGPLAADPRVAALDVVTSARVSLGGADLEAAAREHRVGAMPVETSAGRPPERPGEVAIGPRTAVRTGLAVGETVDAVGPDGTVVPLVVTGIVVLRSESNGSIGEVAQVVPEQLAALALSEPLVSGDVQTVPGAAPELFAELSERLEVFEREVPDAITNLADIVALPELLALVLALVGGAGMVHTVLTATRRHAPGLAVLAVLGATPRQVRTTVAVLAATTVAPALLLGVPLGLAVARLLWAEVARSVGVAGDVALPGALLVGIGPVVLAGAVLVAAVPAVRAARTPPALALRGE